MSKERDLHKATLGHYNLIVSHDTTVTYFVRHIDYTSFKEVYINVTTTTTTTTTKHTYSIV